MKKILFVLLSFVASVAMGATVRISDLPLGDVLLVGADDSFPYVATGTGDTQRLKVAELYKLPTIANAYAPKANPSFTGVVTAPSFIGNLTGNVTGSVAGNASTASAFLNNPTDCTSGEFAFAIAANGNLTCSTISLLPNLEITGNLKINATANRALITNASNQVVQSAVTTTELGLLSGKTNLATLDGTEIFTNKTLTSPTLTTPLTDVVTLDGQASSPSNPSAGNYKLFVSDTSQKLTLLDSTGAETTVGSGSGGGINYIKNPDADVAVTGWSTYLDAAGTSPIDGFGGSPVSTYSRTTTNPLMGAGSFLWTKGAANRQGEGFSYDFDIDPGYRGQQLAINYLQEIVSGTFVTGDMTVWIYDKTNGVLIQPSAFRVESVGIAGPAQPLVFQASSNSTSYRLIFHTATTSALAYSLKFDGFSVGPQIASVGFAGSATAAYVPTVSNLGTGSLSQNGGAWRRVGDSVEIEIYTVKDGSAGSGGSAVVWSMPTGMVADLSRMPNSGGSYFAQGFALNSQSGNLLSVLMNGTTSFYLYNSAGQWNGSSFGASAAIAIRVKIPIVGWSSNTITSDSASGRRVATTMTKSGGTYPASSIITAFSATPEDTHGEVNLSAGTITVKVPGTRLFTANVNVTAADNSIWGPQVNGTPIQTWSVDTSAFYKTVTAILPDLKAGDVIGLRNGGSGTAALTAARMSTVLIQGPSQIQAAQSIALLYQNTAGTSIPSGDTIIPYATKIYDNTGGAWNGSSFTCPAYGIYSVKATANVQNGSYTAGQGHRMYIRRSNVLYLTGPQYMTTGSVGSTLSGNSVSGDVECFTGQTIDVAWTHTSGASPSLNTGATLNTISIVRQNSIQ